MATIKKFKKVETVNELEKEIELPAYFIAGGKLPSQYEKNKDFSPIFKITSEEKKAVMIDHVFIHGGNMDVAKLRYMSSPYDVSEILERFTQVDKSEWEEAVSLLINDIIK